MASVRVVAVEYSDVSELQKAWRLYIKHGAFVTRIDPTPETGARLTIKIVPGWGGDEVYLDATVVQAAPSTSVMQLADLGIDARAALVGHGIEDAAPPLETTSVSTAEAPPPTPPTAEFEPAPEPAAEPEPVRPTIAETMTAPAAEPAPEPEPAAEPAPQPAAEPTPEPPSVTLTAPEPAPAPKPPPTGPSGRRRKPVRQRSSSDSIAKLRAPTSSTRMKKAPSSGSLARIAIDGASGELDVRDVADLSGPVGTDTEMVLPAVAAAGDFGSESWRDVLLDFYSDKATGVIVIHAFRENRWCYVVDGRPVHYLVDHAHPGEYLSDAIVKECDLKPAVWTEAVVGSKISGVPAGEYLVRRGVITQRQLEGALRKRAEAITRNLLGANFGSWTYHPWAPVRELFGWEPIDLLPLILAAERRTMERLTDEEITKETAPYLDKHVSLSPERMELLPQLPLQGTERTLADDLLPGGWTMKEMMVHGGLAEKDLLRFVWVLKAMGFVRLRDDEGKDSKRNRAERRLYVALKDISRRPDFEALHCHWTSIQSEIEAGHEQTVREFGRHRFKDVLDPRLEDLIDRIQAKADEILAKLRSKQGRDQVRRMLVGESQLIMAADLMLKQGDMEAYKGNLGVARVCYERVLELAPRIHETKEARARAKEQLGNPQIAQATLTASQESMVAVGAAVDKHVF